ncbi:MAG: TIGR04100 family radical SAM protein [Clostridia bacterium]|nr:TIGR04100 family radical SAM protein [Clostridia bacterium]
MTITYELGTSLYINMTNKCTNDCEFCLRNTTDKVGDAENLWLEREPTFEEIKEDIDKRDLSKYKSVVFCGFGEPIIRLYDLVKTAKYIKSKSDIHIRINTNGHGDLIFKESISSQLEGVIDSVSISLNAKNADEYDKICHPKYGVETFYAIIKFAKECKKYVGEVIFTVVDNMPKEDIDACREIAERTGVSFRVREYID